METYSAETRHAFEKTLEWLGQWACSRSFGLGSRLPWDPTYLIESLSDSTIYMAYYTVAHILHGGNLDGSKPGSGNIPPEEMTDEVWNYIMLEGPLPKKTKISKATLELMRKEFNYFYPLDLRCSGKDLVTNHLTFFLYNHTAIFPKEKWPRAVRSNGHLLLNSEKMSKSTGNFMTLEEAVARYGADATRFALADAGDGLEDANFLHKTADDAILKLYTEKEWCEEVMAEAAKPGSLRTGPYNWHDRVFEAELIRITAAADKAYGSMLYREALKLAYYDLQNAKGEYRKSTCFATGTGGGSLSTSEAQYGLHKDLIVKYIEIQALLMAVITPHWSEYLWSTLLKKVCFHLMQDVIFVWSSEFLRFFFVIHISDRIHPKCLVPYSLQIRRQCHLGCIHLCQGLGLQNQNHRRRQPKKEVQSKEGRHAFLCRER
jgi:leucyl-tRNA synthetase